LIREKAAKKQALLDEQAKNLIIKV
jgi:hypothetical protein